MIRKRLLEIESKALEILLLLGMVQPPIDVEKIAFNHNVRVVPYAFANDISGVFVKKDGINTVGVNNMHSIKRKRFTIAHELGHFFLEHQVQGMMVDEVLFRNTLSTTGEDLKEREANAFAAALLMPRPFIEKYIKSNHIDLLDDDQLERMANDFNVSTGAMAFRLANLRLFE